MLTTTRKRLAQLLAAGCVAAAVLATAATPAPAGTKDCAKPGPLRIVPGQGSGPVRTQVCFAYRGGELIDDLGRPVGRLDRGFSWFACQARTARPNPAQSFGRGETAFNDHWLLTLSDSLPRRFGWFPATKIAAGENWQPVPDVPFCNASESIPGPLPEPFE